MEKEEMEKIVRLTMVSNKKHIHKSDLTPEQQQHRNEIFADLIRKEIVELEQVDAERAKEGLPPLTDKEKVISVKDGVAISKYREDKQIQAKREQEKASNMMYNNALGIHSSQEM